MSEGIMNEENIIDKVAVALGIKSSQITIKDVQMKIPEIRRHVDDYERQAVAADKMSCTNRAKAFAPGIQSTERARLLRQSAADSEKAKVLAGFASTFVMQLGMFSSLLTTMQIAEDMKNVGLIDSKSSLSDLSKSLTGMQVEIDQLISSSNKLSDAMGIAFEKFGTSMVDHNEDVDELEKLFKQWELETDPVKKAELQHKLETVANL